MRFVALLTLRPVDRRVVWFPLLGQACCRRSTCRYARTMPSHQTSESSESGAASRDPDNRVLRAANRLVRESGSLDISMRRVASAAGVSLRTVYEQFPTRDDLLLAVYTGAMNSLAAKVLPAVDGCTTPKEKLRTFITEAVLTPKTPSVADAVMRERGHLEKSRPEGVRLATQPFRDVVADIVDEVAPKELAKGRRMLLTDIITTTLMAHCHQLASGVISTPPKKLADELSAFVLRGIES